MEVIDQDASYCQRCGHELAVRESDGQDRPTCPQCGYVVFFDPKLAAVVLVEMEGKLVMVRRGVEPALGRWAFPSGYVDRGEAVEDAAVREVGEETGLQVEVTDFIGLYSRTGATVVLAVYAARVEGGELKAGFDAVEVALMDPDELPPLPFYHDDQILADWRALQARSPHPV